MHICDIYACSETSLKGSVVVCSILEDCHSLVFGAMKISKNVLERIRATWPLALFEQRSSLSLLWSTLMLHFSQEDLLLLPRWYTYTETSKTTKKSLVIVLPLLCHWCMQDIPDLQKIPPAACSLCDKASKVIAHYMNKRSKTIVRIICNVSCPILRERTTGSWEKAVAASVSLELYWKWYRGSSLNENQACVSFSLTIGIVKKQLSFSTFFCSRNQEEECRKVFYMVGQKFIFQSIHSLKVSQPEVRGTINLNNYFCHQ